MASYVRFDRGATGGRARIGNLFGHAGLPVLSSGAGSAATPLHSHCLSSPNVEDKTVIPFTPFLGCLRG